MHEEGLHGFAARGATHFPQAMALAATWDPDLVEAVPVVGPEADLDGEVEVDVLSVQGRVRGKIHVRQRLEVFDGGRVGGRIRLDGPYLMLEEGGVLEGEVEIAGGAAGEWEKG